MTTFASPIKRVPLSECTTGVITLQGVEEQSAKIVVERLMKHYRLKTETELAALLGVSKGLPSVWKTRNSVPYKTILSKCKDVDLNWLFWGTPCSEVKSGNAPLLEEGVREPRSDYAGRRLRTPVIRLRRGKLSEPWLSSEPIPAEVVEWHGSENLFFAEVFGRSGEKHYMLVRKYPEPIALRELQANGELESGEYFASFDSTVHRLHITEIAGGILYRHVDQIFDAQTVPWEQADITIHAKVLPLPPSISFTKK